MSLPRPVVVRVRRGVVVASVVGLALALGLAGRVDAWLGSWRQTESYVGAALVLAAPAAAAAAAWVAGTQHTSRARSIAAGASRPGWRMDLRVVFETWGWATLGALAAGLVASGWTASVAAYGRPSGWAWLPVLAFLLLACAAGGCLAGMLPPALGPLAGGAAAYVLLALAEFRAPGVLAAVTPLDGRSMTFFSVPWGVHALQAGALASLGTALVLWTARRRRPAFLAAWLAGALAAPLLYLGYDDRRVDEAATALVCSGRQEEVSVCLPAAKAYVAPEIRSAIGEVWSLVDGLAPRPVVFVGDEARGLTPAGDREIRRVEAARGGHAVVRLSEFFETSAYAQVDRSRLIVGLSRWLFPAATGSAAEVAPATTTIASARDVLERWLLTELGVPVDGSAGPGAPVLDGSLTSFEPVAGKLAWFTALGPGQRRAWFEEHRAAISAGELTLTAFDG